MVQGRRHRRHIVSGIGDRPPQANQPAARGRRRRGQPPQAHPERGDAGRQRAGGQQQHAARRPHERHGVEALAAQQALPFVVVGDAGSRGGEPLAFGLGQGAALHVAQRHLPRRLHVEGDRRAGGLRVGAALRIEIRQPHRRDGAHRVVQRPDRGAEGGPRRKPARRPLDPLCGHAEVSGRVEVGQVQLGEGGQISRSADRHLQRDRIAHLRIDRHGVGGDLEGPYQAREAVRTPRDRQRFDRERQRLGGDHQAPDVAHRAAEHVAPGAKAGDPLERHGGRRHQQAAGLPRHHGQLEDQRHMRLVLVTHGAPRRREVGAVHGQLHQLALRRQDHHVEVCGVHHRMGEAEEAPRSQPLLPHPGGRQRGRLAYPRAVGRCLDEQPVLLDRRRREDGHGQRLRRQALPVHRHVDRRDLQSAGTGSNQLVVDDVAPLHPAGGLAACDRHRLAVVGSGRHLPYGHAVERRQFHLRGRVAAVHRDLQGERHAHLGLRGAHRRARGQRLRRDRDAQAAQRCHEHGGADPTPRIGAIQDFHGYQSRSTGSVGSCSCRR